MKNVFLLIGLLCCTAVVRAQQYYAPKVFGVEELRADIRYCRNFHEAHNTNVYAYHTKAYVDSVFDALERNVQPMDAMTFYAYLSPIGTTISDGHCLIFPPQDWINRSEWIKGYFPYRIRKEGPAFIVTMDLADTSNAFGDGEMPIHSINGVAVGTIYEQVLAALPREGYNVQYPEWIIEKYFYEYYSYVFGHADSFTLQSYCIEESLDTTPCATAVVPAITKDQLVARRIMRYPDYPMTKARETGIQLTRHDSLDAAVLTIFTWDKLVLLKHYGILFKREIDRHMQSLIADSVGTLIIDLRNNQGGYMAYGVHVMRWLMPEKFDYIDALEKVSMQHSGERKYKKANTMRFMDKKPFKHNYSGKVIILTNGGTFSNSSIFTARMQYYGRAIVMGEETGGSATQLTGSFGYHRPLIMPNTKIEMSHINYRIVVDASKPYSGQGVIPDLPLSDEWDPERGDVILQTILSALKH